MDSKIAINNLLSLKLILKQNGIDIFLLYGTALGAIRDGKIIKGDLDTDIGIMAKDFKFSLIAELINNGFKILHIFGMLSCGMEIAVERAGVKTDIMLIYKDDETGKYWNALWDNGGRNGLNNIIIHSYSPIAFNHLAILKLNGYEFFTPYPPNYVSNVYGKDWEIPHQGYWNWRTDHECIDEDLRDKIINKFGGNE